MPTMDLKEANIGQLVPEEKDQLTILDEYRDIFSANSKAVEACGGPPMILELKDPSSGPLVTPTRKYTPGQRRMIQMEIKKLAENGVIQESISQYASACHRVRKCDGSVRVVQDYRGLNALVKSQFGGLGDIVTHLG